MELSKKQQQFIDAVMAGKNVYLDGKAGTGKTFVAKKAIQELRNLNKKIVLVAPSGIAANNLGGVTIHSMFNINPFGVQSFGTCQYLKEEKRRVLRNVDTIFIDEISMLRPDILDAINWTFLKNGCDGIDKRQVIFIGDMKQLEPPIKDNEKSVLFRTYNGVEFYHAKCYSKLNIERIELDEIQRQSDPEFIEALNIIREGGRTPYFRNFVHTEPNGIILAPHNATVKKYNIEGVSKLNTPEFKFVADVSGNIKAEDFNLDSEVSVKQGAKIMFLANRGNLVNGTLGTFVSHEGCHYIRVGSIDYPIERMEFSKKEYVLNDDESDFELRIIGTIKQYPIKLAYALSIHKSQGLTFDEVTVDLEKPCFSKGQLYVALSRVTSPNGLRIITGGRGE